MIMHQLDDTQRKSFYSQAQREARYYGISDPVDIERIAEVIRHRQFCIAIEPLRKMRANLVCRWAELQCAVTTLDNMPPTLKKALEFYDELIADEARKFGY